DLPQPGGHQSPGPSVAPVGHLALEGELLRKQRFSDQVIRTIQASRRPSTTRIYDATWAAFSQWCKTRDIEASSASIPQTLDFLQEGLDKGLAVSTQRRQVAALSTILARSSSRSLSQHPQIKSFLKGAVNISPPAVHRYPSWDLPFVLKALTKAPFEPLRTTSLRHLTIKTAFLVAITSARRVSELAALSVRQDLCVVHPDRVILRLDPSFTPKINCFTGLKRLFCPTSVPVLLTLRNMSGTSWT
ncbi:PREDICTED: uncharacterized protein LOC106543051, partial [Thamnophis sirtalis]|uniref:Uncharacterized protein LOC106543051 n=1 Tax=Thamnophis sirtalis TaxID=35019 RepID=A0A6I9XFI3_9SAUR